MSDEPETADPDLQQARARLRWALDVGMEGDIVAAVEALIDIKIALTVEAMADRIESVSGLRPQTPTTP